MADLRFLHRNLTPVPDQRACVGTRGFAGCGRIAMRLR